MIWNAHPIREIEDNAVVSYLLSEISSVCSKSPCAINSENQRQVASAIASFIRQEHHVPWIESEYLRLLVARALWAVGEEDTARRFLAIKGDELKLAPLYSDVACASDMSMSLWRLLLNSRAVRPSHLSGTAYGSVWVIDILRAVDSESTQLEITIFCMLDMLLEEIAALWDCSKGKGALGLYHLSALASDMLQCPKKSRKTKALVMEIQKRCALKLRSLGKIRGWKHVPDVMRVDI